MRAATWRRSWAIVAGAMTAALLLFVALPILAIFLRLPAERLVGAASSPGAVQALGVSLKTSLIALAVIVLTGTPAAYALAVWRFPGRPVVETLLELPLVLPPAVAGLGLFAAFGRAGLLGGALRAAGVEIPFTQVAVVMAQAFVALPFYVRQAVAAFRSIDPELLGASRTLGAGPGKTFLRVAVPLAAPGLAAGAALAWARALGEFGATIMFAGSLPGRTTTLPLAVYADFSGGDLEGALAISALLVAASAGLLVAVKLLARRRQEPDDGLDEGRDGWASTSTSVAA